MTAPKTKFAGGVNPFTGSRVEVEALKIATDPYVDHRSRPVGKYDAVFAQMKPGQCIVCTPEQAPNVKNALAKWLKANGKKGCARARSRYVSDGQGRVWWLVDA
jgi:hypothetical protein